MICGIAGKLPVIVALAALISAAARAEGPTLQPLRKSTQHPVRGFEPRPAILGERDGMTLVAVSPAERESILRQLQPGGGDGGGGDVANLFLIQDRFLDSNCAFPAECASPCTSLLLVWEEAVENPNGVQILVDGLPLGSPIPGLPADQLPGQQVRRISSVTADFHVFGVEEVGGASLSEGALEILENQPFHDAENVRCEQGAVAGDGTCELVVLWDNPGPPPETYGLVINGGFFEVPGNFLGAVLTGAPPGDYAVTVFPFSIFPENPNAIYRGCFQETMCTLTCEDLPCNPPSNLDVCQNAYGDDAVSSVIFTWTNGEVPYPTGVNILIDGVSIGIAPGNFEGVIISNVALGLHRFGVQGDCSPDNGMSVLVEMEFDVRPATPYTNPITGGITCTYDPAAGATSMSWVYDQAAVFLYVWKQVDGGDLELVDSQPGSVTSVIIANTLETDLLFIQFFKQFDGGCYGSALIGCGVDEGNFYVQSVCNGVGGANGGPQITAAIFHLAFLFQGGAAPPCKIACDANGDTRSDITDAIFTLAFLFQGGGPPPKWGGAVPVCTRAAPEDDCVTPNAQCPL